MTDRGLRMPAPRLTYCGNVHPAEDLAAWLATTLRWSVPIARTRPRPFGLGAWWTAATAAELAGSAAARARVRDLLVAQELELWTLNAFPYAGFHAPVVGTTVYTPSWEDEERVVYTRDVANAAAALVAAGSLLPISTLPLGFRDPGQRPLDLRKCARNLVRVASAFAELEDRTGVRALLALEPEPMCVVETVAGALAFLEEWVFLPGAWPTVSEAVLRRHLGLCVDLCHLAVVGEDVPGAARACRERGVEVAKIQVSSCPEARDARGLERLLEFHEPRYLHQTVAHSGARALDLASARARRDEFAAGGRVRTHFHVPVFWDEEGAFGSTRRELEAALREWPGALPLLEVETYTWGVLPESAPARQDLVTGIAAELAFVARLISF